MRFTNECICWCWVGWMCCSIDVQAQPLTVESAIESAKQKKTQPAVAKTEPLPAALVTPLNSVVTSSVSSQPRLWAIKGINGKYTAEIILNQKIFHIPLVLGEPFDKWEVADFDSNSVTLAEKNTPRDKTKHATPRTPDTHKTLKLNIAPAGNTISNYQIQADGDINTPQRRLAADLPALAAPTARN